MDYEIRTADLWPDVDYELRAASDGFTFEGYAAVYDRPSKMIAFPSVRGGAPFREVIQPGAFTKTLAETPDVTLRYQHQMSTLPLARTRAGTMTLAEDERGLRVLASLPDNEWGRPVRDSIARGDIAGMSFRFRKVLDRWSQDAGANLRTLLEVRLGPEVSVTDGLEAYPDTIATVRTLAAEADVDPDDLVAAFQALKPDARLTPTQRTALLAVVNSRSDAPVVDAVELQKQARMRERLNRIAG